MLILLYGNNIRAEAEPAIAGCRIPGYVAARICDPHARPCAPWTRASGRRCRPARSRPPSLDKRTRRPGESGILTHNIDAKLADIASTAARIDRPVQAGRPWAQCGNIDPLRPPAAPSVNISFCVLAFGQSP